MDPASIGAAMTALGWGAYAPVVLAVSGLAAAIAAVAPRADPAESVTQTAASPTAARRGPSRQRRSALRRCDAQRTTTRASAAARARKAANQK